MLPAPITKLLVPPFLLVDKEPEIQLRMKMHQDHKNYTQMLNSGENPSTPSTET